MLQLYYLCQHGPTEDLELKSLIPGQLTVDSKSHVLNGKLHHNCCSGKELVVLSLPY